MYYGIKVTIDPRRKNSITLHLSKEGKEWKRERRGKREEKEGRKKKKIDGRREEGVIKYYLDTETPHPTSHTHVWNFTATLEEGGGNNSISFYCLMLHRRAKYSSNSLQVDSHSNTLKQHIYPAMDTYVHTHT